VVLGSVATSLRNADQVRGEIGRVRELADHPFAVNLTRRPFDEEVFDTTLAERPAVVSLALGAPGDLVERAHAAAKSEDAVKVEFAEHVAPPVTEGGWPTVPRSLRTSFVDEWTARRDGVPEHADELRRELAAAFASGQAHEYLPLTGQSAGAIKEVLPAAEIVRRVVTEVAEVLRTSSAVRARSRPQAASPGSPPT
jgi:NAD(P)H-dependent flavin oxidoreductase YrpB (nitropropane dioxygenase family)